MRIEPPVAFREPQKSVPAVLNEVPSIIDRQLDCDLGALRHGRALGRVRDLRFLFDVFD